MQAYLRYSILQLEHLDNQKLVLEPPSPDRDDVELITVKGGFYAVAEYSGRSTDQNYIKHSARLFEALRKDNVLTIGDPMMATYNGPFTLPFMRRNEAMYRVNWK